ncbi:MAG: hypothetical protein ABIN95_02185, partial [Mucilaginibacter sp.]
YLLITLGIALLLLTVFEHIQNRFTNIVVVFGRVPFFYYILHLYLLHSASVIVQAILLPGGAPKQRLPGGAVEGFSLPGVYAVWLLAVLILYFPCRWYMMYKMTHKQWWLSYL